MSDPVYYAGLDVGGSTIKACLVDGKGAQVGDLVEVKSHGSEGLQATFKQLIVALDTLLKSAGSDRSSVGGVGIDVPAPCSRGVIWGQANLHPDWVGVNVQEEFAKLVHRPVVMCNDANAAAYGEWLLRPGHDGPLLLVAPGTGLGGGFVLPGGILYEGANGLAMEIGAMAVPVTEEDGSFPVPAGKGPGAVEGWVSLVALRRQLEQALAKEENKEHPLAKSDLSIIEKAFKVRDYAEDGDELALSLFARQAKILGWAMADQASELDPGLIVIGGGLAEASFRDWFLDEVRAGFKERAPEFYVRSPVPPHRTTTRFDWAVGGDGANAVGMAHMALQAGLKQS